MIEKKKLHIEQIKSTVTFTYSSNKCHNIFTKHLRPVWMEGEEGGVEESRVV